MSQCVPSWEDNQFSDTYNDHLHPPNPPAAASTATKLILSRNIDFNVPNSAPEVPMLDYEVAELTWENGQLALHGLGQPRMPTRLVASTSAPWQDKQPGSSGTLESIVNQATCFFNPSFNDKPLPCFPQGDELVPWFNKHVSATSAAMTMDALVPLCSSTNNNNINKTNREITCEDSSGAPGGIGGFTHVDSCSAGMNRLAAKPTRQGLRQVPVVAQDWNTRSDYSANSCRQQVTLDTCTERDQGMAFTSTSIWSADNTSSGMPCTMLTGDDYDSICHSRSIMKDDGGSGENNKKGSSSVKRSRAAAIHNQSERKRRDKINQRMKTLQKLVPNSNKTDKASMLDEVIEYLKQLQAQVTMINRMSMNMLPQMTMMPITLNQQALQMSMMTQMGAAAIGMGGMLDMNAAAALAAGRTNMNVPPFMHPSAFLPMPPASWDPAQAMMPDPMSAFLACQSQPMTMDSYRMMASLYQQMQQAQKQTPNSKS